MCIYRFSFFVTIVLLFSSCGPDGSCNNTSQITTQDIQENRNNTIIVQRGDIFDANVTDKSGQIASWEIADNQGKLTNKYVFKNDITFPVKVSGGYIDVNQNGNYDSNDTLLDINMSSNSNVVTPITTFFNEANESEKEKAYQYIDSLLNLDDKDKITTTLPTDLDTNNDAVILTNALYLHLRNKIDLNTSIQNLKTKANSNSELNPKDMLQFLEEFIMSENNISTLTNEQISNANLKVDSFLNTLSLNDGNFSKIVSSSDSIKSIWDFGLEFNNSKDYSNFNIAIKIVKELSGTQGHIVYHGLTYDKSTKTITNPQSITIYGVKTNGSAGSINYNNINDIEHKNVINGSISVYSNKLMLNLSHIMLHQTVVSYTSFTQASNYKVDVYFDNDFSVNGDINNTAIEKVHTSISGKKTFDLNSKKITGNVNIQN